MRAVSIVLLALASTALSAPARACSCGRLPIAEALVAAEVVADIRVLEVRESRDPRLPGHAMLYRLERIFKAPPGFEEGDEAWVFHQTCNSIPYGADEVGGRRIWFMGTIGGRLTHHYCSTSLASLGPLPQVLLQARARWLADR